MIGWVVMVTVIICAHAVGWIGGHVTKDPAAEDRWTCYAYAAAVGALTGIIW